MRCLLAIPIAVTSIRKDLAVRPCFPITFPTSPGSTEMRREIPSAPGTDSTLTPSGWSTISLTNAVTASAMSECSMINPDGVPYFQDCVSIGDLARQMSYEGDEPVFVLCDGAPTEQGCSATFCLLYV